MRFYATSGSAARRAPIAQSSGSTMRRSCPCRGTARWALGGRLARLAKRGDLRGKTGETALLDADGGPSQRVLVVGRRQGRASAASNIEKATLAAAAALVRRPARATR